MPISEGAPRQYIQPLPGFIPVYVRPGDTPLEDINLELAEAFRSYARKHNKIVYGRLQNEVENEIFKAPEDLGERGSLEKRVGNGAEKVQHIQKIPRP